MTEQARDLVLASASPRRSELLRLLGIPFEVVVSRVEEGPRALGESPAGYAARLASDKATAVAARVGKQRAVLGADTIVVVDDQVLGKPADDADALRMLRQLSGRSHEVITALVLLGPTVQLSRCVHTQVCFSDIDAESAARYIASGEGRDKAGSYAIQGLGGGFVRAIDGSFSNVVGLPAVEVIDLLKQAKVIDRWP